MVDELLKRPQIYWVVGIFILYIAAIYTLGNFPSTLFVALLYAPLSLRISIALSLIFSITIAALISSNVVMAYMRYQERRHFRKMSMMTGVGTVGGFAAGICPACVTGLLPIIFGFFGVTFSFAILPFDGLEIQLLAIIILGINFRYLHRQHAEK